MIKYFFRNKINNLFYVVTLVVIGVVSHLSWFFFGDILSYGDIMFQYSKTFSEIQFADTWLGNSGLGMPNIQLYKFLFTYIWSLLGIAGLPFSDVLRITHLIPIAILGFLSPYILIKHLTKDNLIAFICALFYGSTTPFIIRQHLGHESIAFIISLTPLVFYFFSRALENNAIRSWIIFALAYWIGLCYEPRIMYIVTALLAVYFLFFGVRMFTRQWSRMLVAAAALVGLSIFWILPVYFGGFSGAIGDIAGRDLFGNEQYSISRSFALFQPWWTGSEPLIFILQPVLWYFWFVPVITVLFFLFKPDKKYKTVIAFFAIVWLIGLFLTKQAGDPLPTAFQWLRDNIPGFIAFRSGSKFWFVLTFGYTGLLSFGLLWLKHRLDHRIWRSLFVIFSSAIVIASLLNMKPLVTNKIGGMFKGRIIPNDYLILKDFLANQRANFRTMWTPADSKWGYYTTEVPKISNIGVEQQEWSKFFGDSKGVQVKDQVVSIYQNSFSHQLFNESSIKYVIVPLQDKINDDDFFVSYGGDSDINIRGWYISQLDKVGWLEKIDIGAKDLVVYENKNYKPFIYSDSGLNYYQAAASQFGDFDRNQDLYLNSELKKNSYLSDKLDEVVVPVEADPDKVAAKKAAVDKIIDPKEKKKQQDSLNLYVNNLFLQDFQLSIPLKAVYKIYFKQGSILANDTNISVAIDGQALQQDEAGENKNGWNYFNQLVLDSGEHEFKLYLGQEPITYINSGDIVLAAADLAAPIKTPLLEYRQINPTKYVVKVHGASQSFPLFFAESFHPGWKLYLQPDLLAPASGKFVSADNQGTIQNNNLAGGRFYDLLFNRPVLADRHFTANGFANGWWIDLTELAGQGRIKSNVDGSYDFCFTIEFEPQKYFYLGLVVSGLTLLACLGYLFYSQFWLRYNKRK
jgi:hypothetical protein